MIRTVAILVALLLNAGMLTAQPFTNDATLVDILGLRCNCVPEGYDPVVLIRNDGTAPLAVCTLQVRRNGAFLYNHVFQPATPLPTGQSQRVVLPMVAPVNSATVLDYEIVSVNGNPDQGAAGNTLQEIPNFILTEGWANELELDLVLGFFGPYSWVIRDRFGADVANGGPYPGLFSADISLPPQVDCYSLRVEDISGNSLMDVLYSFSNASGGTSTINGGVELAFDHFPFLVDQLVTGLGAASDQGMVKVYPNPVVGTLFMEVSGMPQGPVEAELVDASGRIMRRMSIAVGPDAILSMDVDALAAGLYTLVLRHQQGMVHRSPVVVQGR